MSDSTSDKDDCDCPLCQIRRMFLGEGPPPPPPEYIDEKFGYDKREVARIACMICNKPIADQPYNTVETMARFGQMMFVHTACEERDKKRVPVLPPRKID